MTVTLGKITSDKNIYPFTSRCFCISECSGTRFKLDDSFERECAPLPAFLYSALMKSRRRNYHATKLFQVLRIIANCIHE